MRRIRSGSELLDVADYYYRLHWAAIELRISGKESNDRGWNKTRVRADAFVSGRALP